MPQARAVCRAPDAMTARLACVLALLVGAAAFDTPLIGDDPRAPVVVDVPLLCEARPLPAPRRRDALAPPRPLLLILPPASSP